MIWHEWDWLLSFHRDIRIGKSPLWMSRKHTIEHTNTHRAHEHEKEKDAVATRKKTTLTRNFGDARFEMLKNNGHSFKPNNDEWMKQTTFTNSTRTNKNSQAVSLHTFGNLRFFYCNIFFDERANERALLCSLTTVSKFEMCARYVCYIAYCWRMLVNKIRVKPEPPDISHAIRSQKSNVRMANENVSIPSDRREICKHLFGAQILWTLFEYNCFLVALNFHAIGKTNQYVKRHIYPLWYMIIRRMNAPHRCIDVTASVFMMQFVQRIIQWQMMRNLILIAAIYILKTFNDYRTPIPFITRDSLISFWWAQTKRMIHMKNFVGEKRVQKGKCCYFP